VESAVLSPDGKYILAGTCDKSLGPVCINQGSARVWEIATGTEVAHTSHNGPVTSVVFIHGGTDVLSSGGTAISVWDALTGKEIVRIIHDSNASALAISPDEDYVVLGGCDSMGILSCTMGTARVWDMATGDEVARMIYEGVVNSVAFDPLVNRGFVVSGGCDIGEVTNCTKGTVRVWEAATGLEIVRATYNGPVYSVAFSPDGKYVMSNICEEFDDIGFCVKESTHVLEVITGLEVIQIVYDGWVRQVSFSPDGKYLVSVNSDGGIRSWLYRPEDLIEHACSHMPRNLTRAEWKQYIGIALPYQAICLNLPIEPEPTATP
jgi:WD40 repeat protein